MDFEIPENLRIMVETVQRFAKKDLEPISRQVEDEDRIPEDVIRKNARPGSVRHGNPERNMADLDWGVWVSAWSTRHWGK